jgi:DUF2946 family protein
MSARRTGALRVHPVVVAGVACYRARGRTIVTDVSTSRNVFGRALRVALCYVLVLHAFAASLSTASAVAVGFGSAICHNAGDEPTGDSGVLSVHCALCAVATSAMALPDPVSIGAPTAAGDPVRPRDISLPAVSRPARAGMARAPPHLA